MNREIRLELAGRALAEARVLNRNGSAILVEGKRDRMALEELRFTGDVKLLNRGWPIEKVVVDLIENYSEKPIILMDWDRTGGRLQRDISKRLESLDILIDNEPRRTLSKALRPETLCVEGLRSLSSELIPIIDLNDPEGAKKQPLL